MNNRLKRALKAQKNQRGVSFLKEINSTFFHFIFVQVIALLWAFIYGGSALYDFAAHILVGMPVIMGIFYVAAAAGGFIGFLLLIYSISLTVAAALAVYRIAQIVDPDDS